MVLHRRQHLTFRPGPAFFADYQRFYANRFSGEIQFEFHDERQSIGEPHRVAYLFAEKRTGRKQDGVPYVSTRDVETAKEILALIPVAEIPDFLDYALAEAEKTRFDVRTLGGVKQYVNGYLKLRQARAAAKVAAMATQAKERETQARIDYDRFRRGHLDTIFNALPEEERESISSLASATALPAGRKNGFLTRTFIEIERARITAERHGDRVPSFEQWHTGRMA